MKIKTSLTDVPFAITDEETLSEIGWNIWDNERKLKEGLISEGEIRNLVKKYKVEELISGYNVYVQGQILPKMDIIPDIHILDCTELEVELNNSNFEGSEVIKDDDGTRRGYKLATRRGLAGDIGVLEEIKMGSIKTHDLGLSRKMVLDSKVLNPGDILIKDRGFISRDLLNQLMQAEKLIPIFLSERQWKPMFRLYLSQRNKTNGLITLIKKRKNQKITFVDSLGCFWRSSELEKDVQINACVVHDTKNDEYFVFFTTDLMQTAKQIIQTYELQPKIEEDYRQIKDFWKIEDFKSTK